MSGYGKVWPLAFILASGAAQADAPVDTSPTAFFQPGSLADTLRSTEANQATDGGSGLSRIQLSQWFNFFNCINGAWRRC